MTGTSMNVTSLVLVLCACLAGSFAELACYTCGSSDNTALLRPENASEGNSVTPGCRSSSPCCKDPFSDRRNLLDQEHNCLYCIKAKYSWSGRDDRYYKRMCYTQSLGKQIRSALLEEVDKTSLTEDERRQKIRDDIDLFNDIEEGNCVLRAEKTPAYTLNVEICGCKHDLCNGASTLVNPVVMTLFTSALLLFVTRFSLVF